MWNKNHPLISIAISCILSGLIFLVAGLNFALGALVILLFIDLIRHLNQIKSFSEWLHSSNHQTLPVRDGTWGHIYANIKKIIDQKELASQRASKSVTEARSAANSLPVGLIFLNEKHEIVWANLVAKGFFDISNEDFGKKATYILRQPEFDELLMTNAANATQEHRLILRLKKPFNDLILSIQILLYEKNKYLVLAEDISDIDRIQNARSDFIADVSHELRTPLTVIHGFLETLEHIKTKNNILRDAIPLMSQQTVRMTRLIEDLLSLTRVESQGLKNEEEVNIPSLVESLAKDARSFPETEHDLLVAECSKIWLRGNAEELRSAFENLISNAIRYTPGGGTITIRWLPQPSGVCFSVEDTGVGISQVDIPRLTERFYRVDKSRSRVTGGTGLGLAIVKHIANRHQATIDIKSEEGVGSVFSIRFPMERCTPPE